MTRHMPGRPIQKSNSIDVKPVANSDVPRNSGVLSGCPAQ